MTRTAAGLLGKSALVASVLASAEVGHASVLEDVLLRIDLMGDSPLSAIMVNLAENIARPMQSPRALQAQDLVIVGYDLNGTPVTAQAGQTGVIVTPDLAASMASGLEAGVYPVGSLLYELPPAGQLSLYEQSRDGMVLAQAQALVMSRVDGSITNVITGIMFPDLAPAQLASVYNADVQNDLVDVGTIQSTVLGAVNTGEIVTNVTAQWVSPSLPRQIGMELAEVSLGANVQMEQAMAQSAAASSLVFAELGGSSQNAALVLNQATNGTAIAGQVRTIVLQQTVSIGEILTTALGAVNAGSVNPRAEP